MFHYKSFYTRQALEYVWHGLGKAKKSIICTIRMVIGDRCGDRLLTTYHRSVNAMNREFQESGDRLKEDFHFCI